MSTLEATTCGNCGDEWSETRTDSGQPLCEACYNTWKCGCGKGCESCVDTEQGDCDGCGLPYNTSDSRNCTECGSHKQCCTCEINMREGGAE